MPLAPVFEPSFEGTLSLDKPLSDKRKVFWIPQSHMNLLTPTLLPLGLPIREHMMSLLRLVALCLHAWNLTFKSSLMGRKRMI